MIEVGALKWSTQQMAEHVCVYKPRLNAKELKTKTK